MSTQQRRDLPRSCTRTGKRLGVLSPLQAQLSAPHAELGLPRADLHPLIPGPSQALGVMGVGVAWRNMPGMC